MEWEFLKYRNENNIAEVILNRPKLHNAFNEVFIKELTRLFTGFEKDKSLRLVLLKAEGSSFCAGADLNWMGKMISYSKEENFKDAQRLEELFKVMNNCPVPVLAMVQGHTFGGGLGILSCCDYVLSSEKALFGFTEVRLGLLPATIAPYVLEKVSLSKGRRFMLSGEKFNAKEALDMELIHEVTSLENLPDLFDKRVESFLKGAPKTVRDCKKLLKDLRKERSTEKIKEMTCEAIALARISTEGQEGMRALLEKRKPSWVSEKVIK